MKKVFQLLLPLLFLGSLSNTAVAQFCAIQPTATNTCSGLNNGSINLEILGGSNDYTFLWSNGANTQNIAGLPAGTYCVTVTHTLSGCSATACATVGSILTTTYYRDQDNDGFGNPAVTQQACSQPNGYVTNSADCNDNNAAIKPGATEVCDAIDNDCDGQTDEGLLSVYYQDFDGDGFGNPAISLQLCFQANGYVANNADCDDNDPIEKPGQVWYADFDNDGYGHTFSGSIIQCLRPFGYKVATELTATTGDCNDFNAVIRPGATEICDGVDNDCDGAIDEGVATIWYRDMDNDGFGNPANTTFSCSQPDGYVANNTDCNDNNATVNPSATEICDGVDNDCDGQMDELAPTANFTWNLLTGTNVQFTNMSTNAQQFAWSFGDGSTSHTVPNPIHTYTAPGNYWVSLTVINCATGCPPSIFTALVIVPGCQLPVAGFSFSEPGTATVNFVDQSTGNPTTWLWNFGDGTTSNLQNPGNHTFPGPGNYTVTLTVTNACGISTTSNVIVVDEPPCIPPVVLIESPDVTIGYGDATTLTVLLAGGNTGHTIIWTPQINYPGYPDGGLEDWTSFGYKIRGAYMNPGVYNFQYVIDLQSDCPVVGSVQVTVLSNTTGTNEQGLSKSIIAYPNPTADLLYLSNTESNAVVEIFNSLGQMVQKSIYLDGVDLENLASGHYFLRVGEEVIYFVKK